MPRLTVRRQTGNWSSGACDGSGGTPERGSVDQRCTRLSDDGATNSPTRQMAWPVAVEIARAHGRALGQAAATLRVPVERVPEQVASLRDRVRELEKQAKQGGAGNGAVDVDALVGSASEIGGATVLAAAVAGIDGKALLELADKLKGKLGDAAIVLGTAGEDRVDLIVSVAPALVERGVKAGEIVRTAAAVVGGGGGGRDTSARAGGKDPAKLPEALEAARAAIEAALTA